MNRRLTPNQTTKIVLALEDRHDLRPEAAAILDRAFNSKRISLTEDERDIIHAEVADTSGYEFVEGWL